MTNDWLQQKMGYDTSFNNLKYGVKKGLIKGEYLEKSIKQSKKN